MIKLKLPFWIITEQKHTLHPTKHFPCDDPLAPHAFTSGDKLIAFLEARQGGRWNITSVADEEALIVAIADLHEQGASRICFDPEPDGSGGHLVSISDTLHGFYR